MNKARFSGLTAVIVAATLLSGGCSKAPKGKREMVLRHVLYTRIRGLDPGNMRDMYSKVVASQIFEPLYQYHFLKRPYEFIPLLAEQMPQISDGGLCYTIGIKRGVRFADDECFEGGRGRQLKADDFVYAIKRIADIRNLSQNWPVFDGRIVGLDEFREYTKSCEKSEQVDYGRQVEGLQAVDDYTLVIRLTKAWPGFVGAVLADISSSPVAVEAVARYGDDIVSHPVGTGPFRLDRWQRGSYIELVRNETFRGEAYPSEGAEGDLEAGYLEDAGRMMPFADRVVWTIVQEYQPAWLLFMQGKIDAGAIPKDSFSDVVTGDRQLSPKMKPTQ